MSSKKKVSYFYDPMVGNYYYGFGHPMRPHRVRMTDALIQSYDLYKDMEVVYPDMCKHVDVDLTTFHSDDYVDFLKNVNTNNLHLYADQLLRFNVGEGGDCPVFDGLWNFCSLAAQGSVAGASWINNKQCDIAINWAGGLHHAKKFEASGFCYVNDIVLGALELLKQHERLLYIDIDIHHGDGVEEAFYVTNRVMCFSLHKFGDYFPGTGAITDQGEGSGKYYSVNIPLKDGIEDQMFISIFEPVIDSIFDNYKPTAVIFQSGADSLSGDRLGCFNLSVKGHAHCLKYVQNKQVPLLVLGGGGYTLRNVAACWAYETAVILGLEPPNDIPEDNQYIHYFCPEYKLNSPVSNMENCNTSSQIQYIRDTILDNLKHVIPIKPGEETYAPPSHLDLDLAAEAQKREDEHPDERIEEGAEYGGIKSPVNSNEY